MRVTEKDTDRADYWPTHFKAEAILVRIMAENDVLRGELTDRQAKAFADAGEAITKALMLLSDQPAKTAA